MASNNNNLHKAKKAKNDEFYTQLSDIEKECYHYAKHFEGKTVLCNCNDALHSGFAQYFSLKFEELGLKCLICTAFNPDGHGQVHRYYGDKNGNRVPDIEEWDATEMEGNGGYGTPEGLALIDEADIIVTNPPFSLFRDFVRILMEKNKKFLIIGNKNAITYKEIFPYIKNNQIWIGVRQFSGGMWFYCEQGSCSTEKNSENGHIGNAAACWFTNLDHNRRHKPLDLFCKYHPENYPKYDNYDAINVNKTVEIPMDYDGVMGVPISFLDKYCPEQFEIVDARDYTEVSELKAKTTQLVKDGSGTIEGKAVYARILIKNVDRSGVAAIAMSDLFHFSLRNTT